MHFALKSISKKDYINEKKIIRLLLFQGSTSSAQLKIDCSEFEVPQAYIGLVFGCLKIKSTNAMFTIPE